MCFIFFFFQTQGRVVNKIYIAYAGPYQESVAVKEINLLIILPIWSSGESRDLWLPGLSGLMKLPQRGFLSSNPSYFSASPLITPQNKQPSVLVFTHRELKHWKQKVRRKKKVEETFREGRKLKKGVKKTGEMAEGKKEEKHLQINSNKGSNRKMWGSRENISESQSPRARKGTRIETDSSLLFRAKREKNNEMHTGELAERNVMGLAYSHLSSLHHPPLLLHKKTQSGH